MVSVILPNYNHAKYLRQRIESILNQTYQDFELIILDDCSIDNSKEIIEEYRNHPKISRIIYNEKNSGQIVNQWRLGLQYSVGDYIWIAESDDYAEEEFLELQVKMLESYKECAMVYCDAFIIDESNEVTDIWKNRKNIHYKTNKWSENHLVNGKTELFTYLIDVCTINNISSCLFRKSILSKFINLIKLPKRTNDWLLFMLILFENDIYYNSRPLNYYREHSESAMKMNKGSDIFIDRFYSKINFINSVNLSYNERNILFKSLLKEFRGIVGGLRRGFIKLNLFSKYLKDLISIQKRLLLNK